MAKKSAKRLSTSEERGQSAIDYFATYGWAILIIAIVVAVFYYYLAVPTTVVPNSCNLVNGIYCNDIIVGTNATAHTSDIALYLVNAQEYPISDPVLYTKVYLLNGAKFNCSPSFVLAGGTILCVATLPVSVTSGSFVSGDIYLSSIYCGVSISSNPGPNCTGGANQTYVGSFTAHAQPQFARGTTLTISAQNLTQPANGKLDRLTATVSLIGYPLRSATIAFTENNTEYLLQPNFTLTDVYGNTLNYISGTLPGRVKVTASYAGLTSNVVINFTGPTGSTSISTTTTSSSPSTSSISGGATTTIGSGNTTTSIGTSTSTSTGATTSIAGTSYPLTINIVPTSAKSDWNACASYTVPGGSAQILCIIANHSNASINVPSGTLVNSLKAMNLTKTSNYHFRNWSGSYSGNQTTATPDATMSGPYTANANYGVTTYGVTFLDYNCAGQSLDGSEPNGTVLTLQYYAEPYTMFSDCSPGYCGYLVGQFAEAGNYTQGPVYNCQDGQCQNVTITGPGVVIDSSWSTYSC